MNIIHTGLFYQIMSISPEAPAEAALSTSEESFACHPHFPFHQPNDSRQKDLSKQCVDDTMATHLCQSALGFSLLETSKQWICPLDGQHNCLSSRYEHVSISSVSAHLLNTFHILCRILAELLDHKDEKYEWKGPLSQGVPNLVHKDRLKIISIGSEYYLFLHTCLLRTTEFEKKTQSTDLCPNTKSPGSIAELLWE